MYVSNGSYVFANNAFFYVAQDVNLASGGNVYLRNQSQMLQGTTGSGANVGLGTLSVYQEGTTNNYQYNYWCSPIGEPNGTVGNSNFGITLINRPSASDKVTSTPATIINTYDGSTTNSSLSISQRWIWKYIASNIYGLGTGGWQYVSNTLGVDPGLGFTMKGVSGDDSTVADPSEDIDSATPGVQTRENNPTGINSQRYDFRGKPNDGTMTAAVNNVAGASYDNMTLVGNPYPSAINLNYYLKENAGFTINPTTGAITGPASGATIDGNAYFWEHSKSNNTHNVGSYVGGYGQYVPNGSNIGTPGTYTAAPFLTYANDGESSTGSAGTGNSFQRMYTPIGQGFMVKGSVSGVVTMRNRYRVYRQEGASNNSQFEKTTNNNPSYNDFWEEIPNIAGTDYTQISKLPVPQFKIHTIINHDITHETAIAFNNDATDDYDIGFDGRSLYANEAKTTYFPVNNGNSKLSITTMPFDINKHIPIAFKTDIATAFDVKVNELINFNLSDEIYLHDIFNNTYYDIKNSDFSTFLPAGENANQYEIVFKIDGTLAEEGFNVVNSFNVFQNNNNAMLTVENKLNKDIRSLLVYDVTGKLVINKVKLGNQSIIEIPTNTLSDGVYIVRVGTNDNYSIDKKVIISK